MTFFLTYRLTFCLTLFLTNLLTFFLTFCLTFFLTYLLTFCLTFFLAYCLTVFLTYLLGMSDILSDILPDILSDISSDILSGNWLTFFLTFCLTYLLTFFLTYLLAARSPETQQTYVFFQKNGRPLLCIVDPTRMTPFTVFFFSRSAVNKVSGLGVPRFQFHQIYIPNWKVWKFGFFLSYVTVVAIFVVQVEGRVSVRSWWDLMSKF